MSIPTDEEHGNGQLAPDLDSQLTMGEERAAPDFTQPEIAEEANLPKANKNYTLVDPMNKPMPEDASRIDTDVCIPVLPDTATRVNEQLEKLRASEIDRTEETKDWVTTLLESIDSSPGAGLFEDRLDDPDADWRQRMEYAGSYVGGIARPKIGPIAGTRMSHKRMILATRARMGLGAPVNSSFFSSGFSATSEPMTEREIVRVWARIIDNAEKLGRRTHGMLFSNTQVYTEQAIFEEWLKLVAETSVRDMELSSLVDVMSIFDMPSIAHTLASSFYPNGVPFVRSVWTEDGRLPKQEIRQILNIDKCIVFDNSMLDDAQRDHMAKRIKGSVTMEQVKKYQDSLTYRNRQEIIDIGDGVKVHLTTPSLRQYFETGHKWIMELNQIVKEAMGEKVGEGTRQKYLDHLQRTSRLCKYAHFVKRVEVDDEIYDAEDGIKQLLETFSSADWIAEKFYRGVSDYINASQIAIVATTSYNEYEDRVTAGSRFPRLIPLDATSVFFQWVEQKLRGIVSREMEAT